MADEQTDATAGIIRKVGESINIGDDITITILGVSGQQVRLGINAREGVQIAREPNASGVTDSEVTPQAKGPAAIQG